jgi:ATP-dependent DNA helicase PIF1
MIGVGTKCKNCRKIINENLTFCSIECEGSYITGVNIAPAPLVAKSELELFLEGKDFAFITGKAGTGKTYSMREFAAKNPKVLLCATTGIAAINLDSSTLHSKLGFFNLKSLEDSYARGFLQTKLHRLAEKYTTIGVDEGSMLSAAMFDIITSGITEMMVPLNLYIIGDMCQLPPVTGKGEPKAEYITKANNWELFDKNTIKLEKIWRQENPQFIEAINAMRESKGAKAVELLKSCNVQFKPRLQESFDGTTIIAINKGVDDFNRKELTKLAGDLIRVSPIRRGKQKSEWDTYIPYEMRFKIGAYVMILSNDTENWSYANGDCGTIEAYEKDGEVFKVKLKRNDKVVSISFYLTKNHHKMNSTPCICQQLTMLLKIG